MGTGSGVGLDLKEDCWLDIDGLDCWFDLMIVLIETDFGLVTLCPAPVGGGQRCQSSLDGRSLVGD